MMPDILIVHDDTGFHLLHGHLHLAVMLWGSGKAFVDVKGFGPAVVSWSLDGIVVEVDGNHLPLQSY